MHEHALKFAKYWKNSLLDSEAEKGFLSSTDDKDRPQEINYQYDLITGCVLQDVVQELFKDEQADCQTVEVILRPKVYRLFPKRDREYNGTKKEYLSPIVIHACLSREGRLYPSDIVIPRELLEPQPVNAFTLAHIDTYNEYKSQNIFPSIHFENDDASDEQYLKDWQKHCIAVDALLTQVIGDSISSSGYTQIDGAYLIKKESVSGTTKNILSLYQHLIKSKTGSALFKRFASLDNPPIKSNINAFETFDMRLGHASDTYPLAIAQRDALSHILMGEDGDILAVNGPPGTGKTTLLLSVIASLWTRHALEEKESPVIFACSTNNQAVTNIIEAFGKDFSSGSGVFAGRWLPEINSFGAYFPSKTLENKVSNTYQTSSFFKEKESKEYLKKATAFYLKKAQQAFPHKKELNVKKVLQLLHAELENTCAQLSAIKSAWKPYCQAKQAILQLQDRLKDCDSILADQSAQLEKLTCIIEIAKVAAQKWKMYQANESIFYAFFSWLPPVRRKRALKIELFLESEDIQIPHKLYAQPNDINNHLERLIFETKTAYSKIDFDYNVQLTVKEKIKKDMESYNEHFALWQKISESLGAQGKEIDIEEADILADTQIRFPAFLLATHYWEGRWIKDMEELIEKFKGNLSKERDKKGETTLVPRYFRYMKLTPCIVSTFFMLPEHMMISRHKDNNFEKGYLYNFIDLLIVDEAGQVLPEVAGASFSLAKQALVIGDTQQIAPIWKITEPIDIGNLIEQELIVAKDEKEMDGQYELMTQLGKSASSGSVMKIAQNASRYHYDKDLERGMYLFEHRRCLDEIISYCNKLCYKNKLIPKRGKLENTLFPAMGYLHINGKCERKFSSRVNQLEAKTIACYLKEQQKEIEAHYGKKLHEIVGIVTPYGAQAREIRKEINDLGLTEEPITIGTVHSLQGAERSIVIFSPVYSKHDDGNFIDSDNSMLNVAVSRAKDSFLVFGDMELFEIQPKNTPRGLLADYLFASKNNALSFSEHSLPEREDLETFDVLHGAQAHDSFLTHCLETVKHNITIISPWINAQKLRETGFLDAMTQASSRGVAITVVTDKQFNTKQDDYSSSKEKAEQLKNTLKMLNERGIHTKLVERVHSKTIFADNNLLCNGSFNWFSASRNEKYERYDTSTVYRGEKLREEIEKINENINKREIQDEYFKI